MLPLLHNINRIHQRTGRGRMADALAEGNRPRRARRLCCPRAAGFGPGTASMRSAVPPLGPLPFVCRGRDPPRESLGKHVPEGTFPHAIDGTADAFVILNGYTLRYPYY